MANVYFELTEAFNAEGPTVALASGQAAVFYRVTIMSKDYPIIGPLAALLPPEREVLLTTDPDRVLALAVAHGARVTRPAVRAARSGDRRAVVLALAGEADDYQQRDRQRVEHYETAAARYLEVCRAMDVADLPIHEAHARMCEAAEQYLPTRVTGVSDADAK